VEKMLNKKDLKILIELRKDARARLTDISKKTGIPISTIHDRLKNNTDNIITKHVSLLDYELMGFNTRAQVCLKCGKNSKQEIHQLLLKHQNINSVFRINNGYDFMFEGIFRNIKDLEEFLEILEEKFTIKGKQIFYIIEDLKREDFFTSEIYLTLLKPGRPYYQEVWSNQ
jgi:DNA-binding Lrp family transcriptional regulator